MLREARIARGDVMSPCTKVCKLDKESSTYCYVGADTTDTDTPLQLVRRIPIQLPHN